MLLSLLLLYSWQHIHIQEGQGECSYFWQPKKADEESKEKAMQNARWLRGQANSQSVDK